MRYSGLFVRKIPFELSGFDTIYTMITTLTPNPSVDRTLLVEKIRFNEVIRTNDGRIDWGGRGFNVSRALRILREESRAIAWVGGSTGKMLEDGLTRLGVHTDLIWVDAETRSNTLILEDEGEWYVRVNEGGPAIPPEAIQAMLDKAAQLAKPNSIWVLAGSLPQAVPENFYAQLIELLNARGVRVFFDASDEPLRLGLQQAPFLVKPGVLEAEAYLGFTIKNYDDAKRAALAFLRTGVKHVGLSLDDMGLLLATQHEMVLATPPRMPVKVATGASDAIMAGVVLGFFREMSLQDIARLGAAFGAATIQKGALSAVRQADVDAMLSRVEVRVINVM